VARALLSALSAVLRSIGHWISVRRLSLVPASVLRVTDGWPHTAVV